MTGGSPAMRRLFVALLLGSPEGERVMGEVVRALGDEDEARRRFRLPRADGLHLTLFFLGDVAAEAGAGLEGVLAAALAGARVPHLLLAGTGAFPRPGRERVLWYGVREERTDDGAPGRLAALHRRVLGAVGEAGFDVSKEESSPFRAHVTVARPRDARRPRVPAAFSALDGGRAWSPAAVALVESVRERGPNLYRAVAEFPLVP